MANIERRTRTTAITIGVVVAGMVGLSFAAVPLYQLFCQVTGYGGTTQIAESSKAPALDKRVTVTFDSNVAPDLAWTFRPVQRKTSVRIGEESLVFYEARNDSNEPVTGTATFNVTPYKVGQYFAKVECFCFQEQTLQPGQVVRMPVSFFVDPAIAQDKNAKDVEDITLSYTFFRARENAPKDKEKLAGSAKASTQTNQRPDKS